MASAWDSVLSPPTQVQMSQPLCALVDLMTSPQQQTGGMMKLNHYMRTPQSNAERFIFATFLAKLQAVKLHIFILVTWDKVFFLKIRILLVLIYYQRFLKNHMHVTNWWCGCAIRGTSQPLPHVQDLSTLPHM